jgi:hypothetical protein
MPIEPNIFQESNNIPLVAVIIVHYKTFDNLRECLQSLRRSSYPKSSVIIVDNNSGSYDVMRTQFPEATILPSTVNLGFAKGNNVGIDVALKKNADYIFLLNDDTVVEEETISTLVKHLQQHPEAGAIQPLLLQYHDHSVADSAGQQLLSKGGAEDVKQCDTSLDIQEIFGPCAAAALYRAHIFRQVGMFDESFFLIHEDTDLSMRMRLAGLRSYLVPTAIVFHKRGISGSVSRRNPITAFYATRNLFILALRYWPLKYIVWYFPLYVVRYLLLLRRVKQCGYSLTDLHDQLLKAIRERRYIQKHAGLRDIQKRWIVKKGYAHFFRR